MENESSITLDSIGNFTWNFGQHFLIQVGNKYYVWSDPDYNGDNTIRPFKGNPRNFASPGFCGRSKGKHIISHYCGGEVKFIDC